MNYFLYMRNLSGLALLFTIIATSCVGIDHNSSPPRDLVESFGFCRTGKQGADEARLLNDMGADWIRLHILWSRVQPEPGPFDFTLYDAIFEKADAAGVRILAIIDYDVNWIHEDLKAKRQIGPEDWPMWLAYVEATATRYGHRVAAFEIWNEPNSSRFWTGTDEDFFLLTDETVRILDRITPNTPVAVGSLMYNPFVGGGRFLKRMLESGAADQADAIALHPYGISPSAAARRLSKAKEMMRNAGFLGELWITEIGFPTGGSYPHAVAEEDQGVIAIKSLASAYAAGADRVLWYELYDAYMPEDAPPGVSSEAFFGIAYPDGTLKSGGEALLRLTPGLQNARWAPDFVGEKGTGRYPAVLFPFEKSDGHVTLVMWSKSARTEVIVAGFPQGGKIYSTRTGLEWTWSPGESIPLDPEPVIIVGSSSGGIILSPISQ